MPPALQRDVRVLGPITVPEEVAFARADLEVYGINHYRPSYTAEIYLNVSGEEELRPDHEFYAGSFSIFGHGTCVGSEGHCETHSHLRRFDDRPSHPLTRAFKRVVITDALRRALSSSGSEVTVTIAATALAGEGPGEGPLLDFTGAQIATFE
jgi:hypothetical protein